MTRKILHIDLDAFFCAVEELHHPELVGKAFAVGGRPNERGVVASCSYPARRHGIHSAMPMGQAVRLFPALIIVPPTFPFYQQASEGVMAIMGNMTPLVEQLSIDEAFLDLSDLPDDGLVLAQQLQQTIDDQMHLPCSIGVASNKLVAKMATDFGKGQYHGDIYPRAIKVVPAGEEEKFLAGLPAQALWGVGPKTTVWLAQRGIKTIGQLAQLPESVLKQWFGKAGVEIARHARGIDDRPVEVEHAVKSISQEITFDKDVTRQADLLNTLQRLSEQVGYRLRQDGLSGATVRIKLRWPDFSTYTRQITIPQPTNQDEIINHLACELFLNIWQPGQPVRLLGVGVSGLSMSAHQFSLWDNPTDKEHRLLEAIDALRLRFGQDAIRRGRDLKKPRTG